MIILMGIQGSGKGTQSKLLIDAFGFAYISTGDLLRQYATPEQQVRMLAGELISDQEMTAMVEQALQALAKSNDVLFDGYPRNPDQAAWLYEYVQQKSLSIDHIFHLVVSRDTVKQRLLLRGRTDDTPDAIEQRFEVYETMTAPLIEYFKSHHVLVHDIDAAQRPEQVHEQIAAFLKVN